MRSMNDPSTHLDALELEMTGLRITVLLADAGHVVNGKLYLLGAGWNVMAGQSPMTLAVLLEAPWASVPRALDWSAVLVDQDGAAVLADLGGGIAPVEMGGIIVLEPSPTQLPPGTPMSVPWTLNYPPLPVEAGARYEWRLRVGDRLVVTSFTTV